VASRIYSTAFSALHNYGGSEEGGAPAEGHTLVIRDISVHCVGVLGYQVRFKDIFTGLTWLFRSQVGPDGLENFHWQGRHVIPWLPDIFMGYTVDNSGGADNIDVYMSGYDLIA
jgi:hypothetical protein